MGMRVDYVACEERCYVTASTRALHVQPYPHTQSTVNAKERAHLRHYSIGTSDDLPQLLHPAI